MRANKKGYITIILVSFFVVGLDQATKFIVSTALPIHSKVVVINDFLNIIHIRNSGVAFGLLKWFGSQYRIFSLILVSAVALFLLVFLVSQVKKNDRLQTLGLSLIFGGAVGNLIDRFFLGEVIDFIDVHWYAKYHWPAFNVADSAITVGLTVIIINELITARRVKKINGQKAEGRS